MCREHFRWIAIAWVDGGVRKALLSQKPAIVQYSMSGDVTANSVKAFAFVSFTIASIRIGWSCASASINFVQPEQEVTVQKILQIQQHTFFNTKHQLTE